MFRQGDVASDVFLLGKGLAKLSYVTRDGKEWVKSFIADSGMFGSRRSQSLGEASPFSAWCVEASELVLIPYDRFSAAAMGDKDMATLLLRLSEALAVKKEKREHDLLCLSAEDRYRLFQREEPELPLRLSQIDIAHYLGITPIALSRIKKRVRIHPRRGIRADEASA